MGKYIRIFVFSLVSLDKSITFAFRMSARNFIFIWIVLVPILFGACSSSRDLREGEYILNKVEVKSDVEGIDAVALKNYVRQKEKAKLFSLFKNPFSRKQVIYDSVQTRLSCGDLLTVLQNKGYMNASVDLLVKKKKKKAEVQYLLHPREQFVIGSVAYDIQDDSIAKMLQLNQKANQHLQEGMPFTVEILNEERKRITSFLADQGYLRFHQDYIQYSADTMPGRNDIAVTLHLLPYKQNQSLPDTLHPRYGVRSVHFYSGDSTRISLRKKVLENACMVREGKLYNASDLQRTYNNFSRLQAVRYTNIQFRELPDSNLLDCDIHISANKTSTLSFQPEGTNTAGDLGAAASLTYTNRNLFRGSEQLSIELRGAYEAIKGLDGYQDQNYTEYSIESKLVFPRFVAPFLSRSFRRRQTANSELSVSWDFQNRPEFHRRVFSTAWRYRWSEPKHHLTYRFDLLDLNYVYMPWISATFKEDYLDNADSRNAILRYNYEDLFIMKIGFGLTYSDGTDAFRMNVETSGNILNGLSRVAGFKTNEDGQHTLFNIAYAQYAKFDFDYTHLVEFDKRNTLALHAGLGVAYPYGNSTMLPFEKRYFSGGANSVRGWNVRELGPGKFKGTDGRIDFINQTGDLKLDINAEYRTSLFWKFQGAAFVDAGNIWTLREYEEQPGGQFKFDEFYKQVAVSYGLGLRLNFDYFILRFDLGMKAINPAYETNEEHWAVVHPKFSRDASFHFAVGLPF